MTELSYELESVEEPFAPRTPQIIGRQELLKDIRSAIRNRSGRSHVFYIVAPGGIGKTRLLEEVGVIQRDITERPFRWSGIVDLYHTSNHSPGGLRQSIIDGLDPGNHYFHEYRTLRQDFELKRADGVANTQLQKLQLQLDEVFLWNYESLASQQRIVLCFDTLELLQYESDIVQALCQVQEVETIIKNWLLEQISQLPNTVTLLAGRPRPLFESQLAQSFADTSQTFHAAHLEALTEPETQAYLTAMRAQRSELAGILSEVVERQIFQITGGRPIYLTLLIDLLLYDGGIGGIFPFPIDLAAATDEQEVARRLVERLIDLPGPAGEIIYYLLYARKGLDADLLHYLVGERWSASEIQDNLLHMREFAFVKFRRDTRQLFLHDEVYDLFDRYFRDDPRTGQEYAPFARYYRQRLAAAASSRERADLMVTLLYYELQTNTSAGYHRSFARWDEEAIKGYETGLDMRLRDEMLRFLNHYADRESPLYDQRVNDQIDRAAIDRDCAVRWVRRYLARGEPGKARQIAAELRNSQHPYFDWERVVDPLYKAGLLIVWGETLLYTGATDAETLAVLDQAYELLQSDQTEKEEQQWLRARLLGRLHNNIGYLHWARGRNSQALAQYQRALPHFKTADIPDERADTLNNMAFTLAQLGMLDDAQEQAKRALVIRQQLDRRYLIALSHNTRGYIYTLQNHPMWGERECREALRIFEDLQELRGIGLACNALGFTLRKRGDQWKLGETIYPFGEVEIYFDQASGYLRRAATLFSKHVDEPMRLWESYNELGSLYCDWGWLARQQDDEQTALDHYAHAIDFQKQARTIAEEHSLAFQIVDSYDDLAQVYHDRYDLLTHMGRHAAARTDYALAEACLEKILAMVPQEFFFRPGQGLEGAPEPGDAYWLAMGKVDLQQGIWAFRHIDQERLTGAEREGYMRKGIWHFALATGYFQRYWPQSQGLGNTLRALASRLEAGGVDAEFARAVVQEAADTYRIDLDRLLKTIDNILGV
jgi:tetratricopeptide (TPR) repeat protein